MSKEEQRTQGRITSEALPPAIEVRRGAYGKLTLYDVDESELELLAHGSPDSLYLNFAIFLLSVATSFLIALLTLPDSHATASPVQGNSARFVIFVIITTVGFVGGIFLLLLWLKKRRSISALVQKIKNRLPPEGIQESKIGPDLPPNK